MPSDKSYLDFVLEQISMPGGVTHKSMMGEFLLYYEGKLIGGLYDDRLLIKPTPSAQKIMRESAFGLLTEIPYDGAKPMILADVDDPELTRRVIAAAANDLPAAKKK
ncbi:MAG: competence protein TfoX [Clostridia bacterium]|nr:competence protein TfoX [Clostridia bacterium]